jgi:hypothetical protein
LTISLPPLRRPPSSISLIDQAGARRANVLDLVGVAIAPVIDRLGVARIQSRHIDGRRSLSDELLAFPMLRFFNMGQRTLAVPRRERAQCEMLTGHLLQGLIVKPTAQLQLGQAL